MLCSKIGKVICIIENEETEYMSLSWRSVILLKCEFCVP